MERGGVNNASGSLQSEYKFFEEHVLFNWDMIQDDPQHFVNSNSLSMSEKLEQLYTLLIYFLDLEDYKACQVIKNQIEMVKVSYRNKDISQKGF
jgi:hypothetical protein